MTDTRVDSGWALACLEAVPDAVICVNPDLVLAWANRSAERLFGWERADKLGCSVVDLVHPDDLTLVGLALGTVRDKEVGSPIEVRVATARGWVLVEIIGSWAEGLGDGGQLIVGLRDITERRRWDLAGGHDEQLRRLVDSADSVTLLVSREGTVLSHSPALTRRLGHDPEAVQGAPLLDLIAPEDRATVRALLESLALDEVGAGTPRGTVEASLLSTLVDRVVPYELTVVDLSSDPVVGGFVVTAHDLTRLKEAQQALEHQALHDELTDLPNRRLILRELTRWLSSGVPVAVAFVDLDRFKPVNDLFGHDAGDTVLCAVAVRLVRATAGYRHAMVARHGGDEFVVIAQVDGDRAEAATMDLCSALGEAVADPITLSVGPLQMYASVGGAWSRGGEAADVLIAEADTQMYVNKRLSRGTVVTVTTVDNRRVLAEDLVGAVGRGEIVVHYQPIVDLVTLAATGVEALVRWRHPTRGLLSPGEFLSIAEDIGLDREIDQFVLRTACAEVAERIRTTGDELRLTVNVSADHIVDIDVPETVARVLADTGLRPDLLWLEITEHAVLQRATHGPATTVLTAFARLADLGVRLAIDDFGTGFSSLVSIVNYPIHMLKIDQSFVMGVDSDPRSAAMVEALVALTGRLGIRAVAEGIERPEQLAALQAIGCPFGQGYLFGRPRAELPDVAPRPLHLVATGSSRA
jgi:diguanylate cyclase (GGDEF)-like protein/PAS domain S-box-containing protein